FAVDKNEAVVSRKRFIQPPFRAHSQAEKGFFQRYFESVNRDCMAAQRLEAIEPEGRGVGVKQLLHQASELAFGLRPAQRAQRSLRRLTVYRQKAIVLLSPFEADTNGEHILVAPSLFAFVLRSRDHLGTKEIGQVANVAEREASGGINCFRLLRMVRRGIFGRGKNGRGRLKVCLPG